MRRSRVLVAALATLALLVGACGGDDDTGGTAASPTDDGANDGQLSVVVASYDLAVGDAQRFIAGVLTPDKQLVGHGEVTMRFFFLGEEDASGEAEERATTSATFVPVPGMEPDSSGDEPTVLDQPDAAGVYQTAVDLDQAGFWGVQVVADLADGTSRSGTASFQVAQEHQVPAAGDPAPSVRQATIGGEFEVPSAEIDSRAASGDPIPDPELHDVTIEQLLTDHRPFLVVVSTPVYCVSRFCGPITDTVAELDTEYGDVAEFVHLEVWKDYEAQELNESAAAWIQTPDGGAEPWTFLVGADGTVVDRWDNVLNEAELRAELDDLRGGAPAGTDTGTS